MPLMFDGRVSVAPRASYINDYRTDHGGGHPEFGSVEEIEGEVHFTSFLKQRWSVTPVHWGNRHYLIPERSFMNFCQDINSGMESRQPRDRYSHFLLRHGDNRVAATGLPTLPEKYLRFIFKQPVLATVIEVQEMPPPEPMFRPIFESRATIDRGLASGLFLKANLDELTAEEALSGLVTEINDDTSVLSVFGYKPRPPSVGTVFTTRPIEGTTRWI